MTVWVDGAPARSVSPLDRGLHFGEGLFETIACVRGRPRFLVLHLERLASGCARLGISPPDLGQVEGEVRALAGGADRSLIKLLVTGGEAVARGYGRTGSEKATRLTIRYPWPHEEPAQLHDGVMVRTLSMRLGENPRLAGLKHCNRLEQVLARAELAAGPTSFEGILFSSTGVLVSGTQSNLFLVHEGTLLTPRIDRCGVAGVMRRVVLREALQAGIPARECELRADDLRAAEEIFLTNARIGICPVRSLEGRTLAAGPLTRRMQSLLEPLLNEPA